MPNVPRLDSPQVQQAALPNMRVNDNPQPIEAFGGGKALTAVTNEATDFISKVKNDADQVAVMEADQKMSAFETDMLYNPQTGALNKRGKDAFGLPDTVRDAYKQKADEIASSLNNPVQQAAFSRSVQSRFNDVDKQIQHHVSQQVQEYDDQTTKSYIDTERSAAALNYQDPERIGMAIQRQQAAIIDQAKRNGLPDEWKKEQLQNVTSQTHVEVVQRMLANGEDLKAKAYYEANKDGGFTGQDSIKLEKDLEEGSTRGESQRLSDKIFADHGQSLTAATDAVKQITDPKIRDATMERVRSNFAMQEVADREHRTKLQTQATNTIDQTGSIDAIPPNVWNQFELGERSALKAYARSVAEKNPIKTDWNTYYDLRTQAEDPNLRDKFMQTNLMEHRADLSDSDFKQLVDLQAGLHKGDDKTIKALDGFRTDNQIVEDAFSSIGKSPAKDKEEFAQLRKKADGMAVEYAERTGKKPTQKEFQAMVDGLTIEGVTQKGFFFDTKKRVYELQDGETADIAAKDIPKLERDKIEAALKRRGVNATDSAIVELYSRKLQGKNNGG